MSDFLVLEARRHGTNELVDGQTFFCDTVCMNAWKKKHKWEIVAEEEYKQVFDGPDDSLAPDQDFICAECGEELHERTDF